MTMIVTIMLVMPLTGTFVMQSILHAMLSCDSICAGVVMKIAVLVGTWHF